MSGKHRKQTREERVELKYCEHCGGLWVREPGTGVYCSRCEQKVADLPMPKKSPARVILPKREMSLAEEMDGRILENLPDLEAVGGVA